MKRMIKVVCLLLTLTVLLSPAAQAEERGSKYFACYDAWIEESDIMGRLELWFDVTAVDTMDELGAYCIDIMESTDGVNFTTIDSFYPNSFPNMKVYNTFGHMDYVTFYHAVPGRYYKAYVHFWAKLGNGFGTATTYSDIVRFN